MKKKRWIKSAIFILFISILLLSEFMMLSSQKVGLINTSYRFISGAPHISTQGQTLSYQGKMHGEDFLDNLEPYSTSDDGTTLYKAFGTPVPPPWIYVKYENNTVFRYKYPRLPWKM
ncbi:hypothetical protein SAMN05720606_101355 [Paenibacillus polysaccharolyticus]|uniref:Uncharacterized protein n=1 Tax=Paenibacillus polysaccharolyticus TaxID=582692 RepID=A0A1G5BG95_9BACL|nr:hypothetical protein [Paenibacillus polysaccharolyticus]SCX88990.1 hypothetical protein SAMN05720606_101355 [Paenibacillus polysaccharolyticus]